MEKEIDIIKQRKKLQKTTTLVDYTIKNMDSKIIKSLPNVIRVIRPHITKLSSLMSTPGPEKRPVFTKIDEKKFIDSTGIPFRSVTNAISKCKLIKKTFITQTNEFFILSSLLIFFHYKNKTIYKKVEIGKVLNLYMGLRIYKNAFSSFFPNYLPNPDVMAATIEGLDSNRYNLKKYKTIYNTIVYIADSHYENFEEILKDPIDDNIIYYIINLYNRIKLMMRTIANLYYENHEKGVKQGTDVLLNETDDGETYLSEVENVSSLIVINSRKIYMSFISDNICNPKILRSVCKNTKISLSKMTITINKMIRSRDELIETLIIKILTYFYMNGGKQIKSTKFISMMYNVYSVSNTTNNTVLEIKEILDKLMRKYSKEYLQTNNVSSISNLKKTLFLYLIFYIVDIL